MKKNLSLLSLTMVFVLLSATIFAQDNERQAYTYLTPKWISSLGYWMVESNIKTPKHNIVYCYNNENVLVYKETVDGVALKLNKRKIKMHLKKIVDRSVIAYLQKQKIPENELLVMHLMK